MKKATTIMKIISSSLLITLGLVMIICGLIGEVGYDYYGRPTNYMSYGGDAYTGIQNASADISSNVAVLGYSMQDVLETAFLIVGIVIVLVGVYMLAIALQGTITMNSSKGDRVDPEKNLKIIDNITPEKHTLETLERYKKLLDSGVVTQEEFDAKKKQLLNL